MLTEKLLPPAPRGPEVDALLDLSFGLRPRTFVGWVLIVIGLLNLPVGLLTLLGPQNGAAGLFLLPTALAFLGLGWWALRHTRRERARRTRLLRTGTLLRGEVTDVGLGAGLALSFGHPNTVVSARFRLPDGRDVEARFSTPLRPEGCATGGAIQGLADETGEVLFPTFFGVRFTDGS
jgi:hypothetical protein